MTTPPPHLAPLRDQINDLFANLGRGLAAFGEQLLTMFGAVSESAARFLGVRQRLTRTEFRALRALTPAQRRHRRAERRRQRRTLVHAQRAHRYQTRRRRVRIRGQQRASRTRKGPQ